MTKAEFLSALAGELSRLPETERREHLDYYSELIDDMMEEDGLSEQEAVDRLDDVYAIAADILRQRAPEGGAKPAAPGKKRGVLIRCWDDPALREHARISIGTREQMRRLVLETRAILSERTIYIIDCNRDYNRLWIICRLHRRD